MRTALALVASLLLAATPPASVAQTSAPTVVNVYEPPCYQRERVLRDVPAYSVDPTRGELAYVRRHLVNGTPDAELADYWAALRRCDAREPIGRFDWSRLRLVRTETIR